MLQVGRHVNPRSRLRFNGIVTESQSCLALDDLKNGRHRSRVFGQFLALAEAEDHRLDIIVIEKCAPEDSAVGRLGFGARDRIASN